MQLIFLFSVIATGIQYCMNYAAHWERKFTISENITAEVKRRQKRLKKEGKSDDDIKAQVKRFSFINFKMLCIHRWIRFGAILCFVCRAPNPLASPTLYCVLMLILG